MGKICPWWAGYLLANPLRKLIQNPDKILSRYLRTGMVAVDIGSGMGYFSVPMAALVGDRGRVICVDVQNRMISSLKSEASTRPFSKNPPNPNPQSLLNPER